MTLHIGPANWKKAGPLPYGRIWRAKRLIAGVAFRLGAVLLAILGLTMHYTPVLLAGVVLMVATGTKTAAESLLHGFGNRSRRGYRSVGVAGLGAVVILLGYTLAFGAFIPKCDGFAPLHQSLVTLLNAPDPDVCPIRGAVAIAFSDLERLTGILLFGVFISLVVTTVEWQSRPTDKRPPM